MWNPLEHAARLRIPVDYAPDLPEPGRWYLNQRRIVLRAGMTTMQERSVLAHELGHAVLGHPVSTPRAELQADRWAARKLVTVDALERVAAATPDLGQWCVDLVVTPRILEVALTLHHTDRN